MNPQHDRYLQTHQKAPFYFHLSATNLFDDILWIERNGIENIQLSQYEPYNIQSLDVLFFITSKIKRLNVYIKNADLSRLKELNELGELSIGEAASSIDVTGLHDLKEFYWVHTKDANGLATLKGLKSLTLVKAQQKFFTKEMQFLFTNLDSLAIYSGKFPDGLGFLNNASQLKHLELFNIKEEIDISVLLQSKAKIETLKIEKCKKVINLESTLPCLTSLHYLSLIDSVSLSDINFVAQLPNFKTLVVMGTSFIVNGSIDMLKQLEWVSIDNKKHYSLKNEDLGKTPPLT